MIQISELSEKQRIFLEHAFISRNQLAYVKIKDQFGIRLEECSAWWEELRGIREELKPIRDLWKRKCVTTSFWDFEHWYKNAVKKCHYCGITPEEIESLIQKNKIYSKRLTTRGRKLEIERLKPNTSYDNLENLVYSCYWCNNAKTDEFSEEEFKLVGKQIATIWANRDADKITDGETNFLYLSDKLSGKYPHFYKEFEQALKSADIRFDILTGTNDVWAVDYMPVQITDKKFVQFSYNPDYLREYKVYQKLITNSALVCETIGINPIVTDIVVDGGNVVKSKTKALMTSKIFKENPGYTPYQLLEKIEELLQLIVIIIPTEPQDWIGHADGMVRFFNEETVLLNDYSKEENLYYTELKMILRNAGLQIIEIPYNPYFNKKSDDANGLYINYLQMKNKIFLPTFDLNEDELALRKFEELFTNYTIIPVKASEIAKDGGVLNCISWNIKIDN